MEKALTSETNPIRVAFLPDELLGGAGRLGLTFAPGKKTLGMAGLSDRDLDLDLARLRNFYRTDVLVSLLEPHEFPLLGIPDLLTRARVHGIEPVWFPIPDFGVPESEPELERLVGRILGDVGAGRTVVIHCRGGLGRTGLVGATCLTALGVEVETALAAVRAARHGAVQTEVQENFVRSMSARLRPR